MNARGEIGSPDPLASFPPLRIRQSDGASRRSSCDGDSEFERYCSANSVMGTPSTSMSMCSAFTVFHDFSDCDFADGLENFSLGKGTAEANRGGDRRRSLRYGSSGLEMYGDCSDELAMTALDSSEVFGFNRIEESNGNGEVSVGEGGGNGFELEFGERQEEEEEEEQEEDEEEEDEEEDEEETLLSEGEDSMYNYGSDGDGGNKTYLSNTIHYHEEPEVRNENSLFMNSSVAFGSRDLDDFLLQNGTVSVISDLFRHPGKKNDGVNSGSGQKEEGKAEEDMVRGNEVEETKDIGYSDAIEEVRDREDDMLAILEETSPSIDFLNGAETQVHGSDDLVSCPETSSVAKGDEVVLDRLMREASWSTDLDVTYGCNMEKGNVNSEEAIATSDAHHLKAEVDDSMFKLDRFNDGRFGKSSSNPSNHLGNVIAKSFDSLEQIALPSDSGMRKTLGSSSTSTNLLGKSSVESKTEDFELNEFYDEVVQEMEEILLESVDSPVARLSMHNRLADSQFSMPSRDGGLTASTSSTDDAYMLVQRPRKIDRIEVVGACQKKGDVSFSERLVGVKEYTVYKIKVWSGKDQWEVERRYRDFLTLHRCMKTLFNEQGWKLPLPWSSVEKETQIFRSASPDIIVKRSVLIQECLQSILRSRFSLSPPRALIWFLSHQDSYPISPVSNAPVSYSSFTRGENMRNISNLGKTISLIVEIPPNKSMKQLLEAQHHICAGCHKHFDDGKTLIWDFVQTFGWGKPRLCEYTGQLFCHSCHTNETAVLPARVLHHWDFTHCPVSQLAKSYLDSIYEQPMLCVTAVNPFLLSKVPALLHIMNVRKKIGTMLPYVRCPFRRSIYRGLGNRRHLLESNDFFALRDLIDLSRGVFAALPVMVETVSRQILEHITDQCLICCDVGVPCNARQDCSDPSSLIFPFQEDDIKRCKACELVFHKRCFGKIANCPCGAQLRLNETGSLTNRGSERGALDLLGRGLSSGLFSGLFTKEKPDKTRDHKDENIILMGSLPSTSL
ncbi:Differentially expressed in FDCP 8-like B, partial [Mucuna pruriens]